MQINTKRDGMARFALTQQEFRCLKQAADIVRTIGRNVELATGYETTADDIGRLLIDLSEPKTVEA